MTFPQIARVHAVFLPPLREADPAICGVFGRVSLGSMGGDLQTLVTGVSGYVGAALVPRLRARRPRRARLRPLARAGGARPASSSTTSCSATRRPARAWTRALDGVDVAYYLIHSMEGPLAATSWTSSAGRPRRSPPRRRDAGVRRIVYLGGLLPADGALSRHLASRLAVEEALLDAAPESVALRASIVVAARSRSFRFLVRLIERLPVLALPAWRVEPHAADRRPRRARVPGRRRDARRRGTPAARGTSAARTS